MVAATKTKPSTRPATTGAIIDQLWASREEKRRLEEQVKEVEYAIKGIEETLMERLGAEGLEKATGSKASVSITSTVTADVQDWDAFYPYIAKNKFCCNAGHPIRASANCGTLERKCRVSCPSLNGGSTSALSPDL